MKERTASESVHAFGFAAAPHEESSHSVPRHYVKRFASDFMLLASVRKWVSDRLRQLGWLSERSDDVAVVTSELATNAIEHGTGADFGVAVRANADETEITVESEGHLRGLPVELPPPEQSSGRGLVICRRLADELKLRTDGTRTWVTARFVRR